jgi:hypothetical protein
VLYLRDKHLIDQQIKRAVEHVMKRDNRTQGDVIRDALYCQLVNPPAPPKDKLTAALEKSLVDNARLTHELSESAEETARLKIESAALKVELDNADRLLAELRAENADLLEWKDYAQRLERERDNGY